MPVRKEEKNTHHEKGETSVAFGIDHIGGHLFVLYLWMYCVDPDTTTEQRHSDSDTGAHSRCIAGPITFFVYGPIGLGFHQFPPVGNWYWNCELPIRFSHCIASAEDNRQLVESYLAYY